MSGARRGTGPCTEGGRGWGRSSVQRGIQSVGAVQGPRSLEQKQTQRHTRLKTIPSPLRWRAVVKPRMITHTLHFSYQLLFQLKGYNYMLFPN